MAGRAYLYGLGAAGEKGVDFVLEHLKEGLVRTMALTGAAALEDLSGDLVRIRDR